MLYDISINGKIRRVELESAENGWVCRLDGSEFLVNAKQIDETALSLLIDGQSYEIRRASASDLFVRGKLYQVSVDEPRAWRGKKRPGAKSDGPQKLVASMPGKIVRVLAAEGDTVAAGQGIAVIEAMKMQNEIRSVKAGVLGKLHIQPGSNVTVGEVLAIVD